MYSLYGTEENSASYGAVIRRTVPASSGPEMENPPSSQLALTAIYPPTPVRSSTDIKTAIENKARALADGSDGDSYLSFSDITPQRFQYIESNRDGLGAAHVRFTYFADIETLIVKVPSEPHEGAHIGIANEITYTLRMRSRVSRLEVWPIGATRYPGNSSSKESDSGYKNRLVRPQGAWPHWVIESGMSESLDRLHADAAWWINNSNGDVRLVILVWVRPRRKTMKIETWVPEQSVPPPGRHTRSHGPPPAPGGAGAQAAPADTLGQARGQ